MDVAVWLRGLGLQQYEALFRENDIDAEVLSDLTDGDLEKIGVSLGHRKRLLKAVAALAGPAAVPPASTAPIPPVADATERRQLTVMFCDLVGSTALTAWLDPEDVREVIRAYQDTCSGAISRYDGFVAKFMGDGVLAYFGFPRAHEEDAERAVRAGLDIPAVVAKLETRAKETLNVRIGIATGTVCVAAANPADFMSSIICNRNGVIEVSLGSSKPATHGTPLAAAALQFPLAHPIVASIIPGAFSPDQVRQNVEHWRHPIPASLWWDLKSQGLIAHDAPTP